MLLVNSIKIPTLLSLIVIVGVLIIASIASIIHNKKKSQENV
jgi:hypothetical protein